MPQIWNVQYPVLHVFHIYPKVHTLNHPVKNSHLRIHDTRYFIIIEHSLEMKICVSCAVFVCKRGII